MTSEGIPYIRDYNKVTLKPCFAEEVIEITKVVEMIFLYHPMINSESKSQHFIETDFWKNLNIYA